MAVPFHVREEKNDNFFLTGNSRMQQSTKKTKVVGYWFNEKKCLKFGVAELKAECE